MRKKADDSLTKVRLLETGARLFARYGFDATTTRMIAAEAGLNIATMAFHFGNKENFFHQVLLDTANHIRSYYEPLGRQVQSLREAGELDREKAWELICRYVDLVLSIVANMQEPYTLSLLFHEQNQRLFPDPGDLQRRGEHTADAAHHLLGRHWFSDRSCGEPHCQRLPDYAGRAPHVHPPQSWTRG